MNIDSQTKIVGLTGLATGLVVVTMMYAGLPLRLCDACDSGIVSTLWLMGCFFIASIPMWLVIRSRVSNSLALIACGAAEAFWLSYLAIPLVGVSWWAWATLVIVIFCLTYLVGHLIFNRLRLNYGQRMALAIALVMVTAVAVDRLSILFG